MSRHTFRLVTAAVALVAVFGLGVSSAAGQAEDPASGQIDSTRWKASFDTAGTSSDPRAVSPAGLNAGHEKWSNPDALVVSGTFLFKGEPGPVDLNRSLKSVVTTVAASPTCAAGIAQLADEQIDYRTRTFRFKISSACNQRLRLAVTGTTTAAGIAPSRSATMTTDVTFAVPAVPVRSVTASVEDIDSRDVSVSWVEPEGSEVDASYQVQRLAPDSDEWVTVGSDTGIVDAVEETGIYRYRVLASRPLVDSVYLESAVAEVHVGIAPPTTTNPDDETPTTGPDGETTTTVTLPDSTAPISVPSGSSSVGNSGVSSHTTVTAAPQSPRTTIDTGFEETLDYGLDDLEPGQLAAEGQSVLATETDTGVIGPGAVGASLMVMFGWAGHYLYFRRLAAQF